MSECQIKEFWINFENVEKKKHKNEKRIQKEKTPNMQYNEITAFKKKEKKFWLDQSYLYGHWCDDLMQMTENS